MKIWSSSPLLKLSVVCRYKQDNHAVLDHLGLNWEDSHKPLFITQQDLPANCLFHNYLLWFNF